MNNNIQQFLEEKSKATASYLNCSQEDVYVQYLTVVDFVLSEVEREVENNTKEMDNAMKYLFVTEISTLLDQLKLK